MTPWQSWRDVWMVARFEVSRAVRTWRALAIILAWLIANLGGCWLFIEALGEIEGSVAATLGVAPSRWPGALTEQLRTNEQFLRLLGFLVGDQAVARELAQVPVLAIFQLWMAFLLIPYLAATNAAESVALDVGNRAVRYELLRTGRAELVAGRFVGQLGLTLVANTTALVGVWLMGMLLMVKQPAWGLAAALAVHGAKGMAFAVPYIGMGLAASQITASAAWARVIALITITGVWVVYGLAQVATAAPWTWLADGVLSLLPPAWIGSLWRPDAGPLGVIACVGIGGAWVALGYQRFRRMDL